MKDNNIDTEETQIIVETNENDPISSKNQNLNITPEQSHKPFEKKKSFLINTSKIITMAIDSIKMIPKTDTIPLKMY